MSSLLGSIRGTVQGVIGATDHVLWWVQLAHAAAPTPSARAVHEPAG